MGEMGVLACHGLVSSSPCHGLLIRRDIFFFSLSIKHWLRHLPRMEGNGGHSKKRSSRI